MHLFHNYYTVLNVPPSVAAAQIEVAFQAAMRKHADMGLLQRCRAAALGYGKGELRMAYKTLIDPDARARYDLWKFFEKHIWHVACPPW